MPAISYRRAVLAVPMACEARWKTKLADRGSLLPNRSSAVPYAGSILPGATVRERRSSGGLDEGVQMTMGWTFSHLWEFEIDGRSYGDPSYRELDDEPVIFNAKGLRWVPRSRAVRTGLSMSMTMVTRDEACAPRGGGAGSDGVADKALAMCNPMRAMRSMRRFRDGEGERTALATFPTEDTERALGEVPYPAGQRLCRPQPADRPGPQGRRAAAAGILLEPR